MIAACPKCEARYRIEREKLGTEGVRLRCSKCQAVFRVRAPSSAQSPRAVEPAQIPDETQAPDPAATAPAVARRSSAPMSAAPRSVSPGLPEGSNATPAGVERSSQIAQGGSGPPASSVAPGADAPLVLVGTPDEEVGKKLREALESWGIRAAIVADGVEMMLEIQRQLPAVIVLAPTLPRMFGFQVCEIVKRNESLKHIGVVLLGVIHRSDRYRRSPEELYGADAYVEEPDLPDALLPELRRLGIGLRAEGTQPVRGPGRDTSDSGTPEPFDSPAARVTEPAGTPGAVPDTPRPPSRMADPAVADVPDELADARAQAERLARIIVSDIVIYNEEKFAAAIETGTVAESLAPDLEEGRGLFRDRIDPRLRDEKDYLTEELLRVARSRGMH